jgi:16S rRNA (guanine527-N7)-methyltransferase
VNLVARKDLGALWSRHIADCLQLGQFGPLPARGIDLGSGAGFPGLVLAIQNRIQFDLIEQDKRKAAFLREAARITDAPVTVHAASIDGLHLPPAPLVTARALAPLPKLLSYAERLLTPEGSCLFMKGRSVDGELAEARLHWRICVERRPSQTDPDSVILRISDIRRA